MDKEGRLPPIFFVGLEICNRTKFRKKITFQKHEGLFKMALITPAPLTPAFINATRKNNADLGPAL